MYNKHMHLDYWHTQTADQPLFPDLEWSRPENRAFAGKLLIIGGNAHGFAAPAEAYGQSLRAGIGAVHALLPDAIQKIVGRIIAEADYAPSTPSGSFSQKALAEMLAYASWADGVLLAGDLGRNSETAIALEKFLQKCAQPVVLTRDAVDYVTTAPQSITDRPGTTLVLSLSQLQRLGKALKIPEPVQFSMSLMQLIQWLHRCTLQFPLNIVVHHADAFCVAVAGQVSTTKDTRQRRVWRLQQAAHASVWLIQNPSKPFEALTVAMRLGAP